MKQKSLDHLRTLTQRHQQFLIRWHERQARTAETNGNYHKAAQHHDNARGLRTLVNDRYQ